MRKPWRNWNQRKRMWLVLGWMLSISGCHSGPSTNQFFCPPVAAYHADGSIDKTRYGIDKECWISSDKKLKACYLEAK